MCIKYTRERLLRHKCLTIKSVDHESENTIPIFYHNKYYGYGETYGIRTHYPLLKREMLYLLS